ncbi:hypothetical protein ABIB25_005429 [Nakamurella sp. UYEF19]|uniref:hypothetical protein n=1 Tax=Nakamurella sp. UYEF19 TaxID=1756392 RepID=UPI003394CE4E
MGVRERITALALREVHVMLIERPGGALTRIAAERSLAARGWRVAGSAADADALLCCGEPGPELEPLVQALFVQLPRPRAEGRAQDPGEVAAALDQIAASLQSGDVAALPAQYQPAPAEHGDQPAAPDADTDMSDGDGDHTETAMDMDMGGDDMDHSDMDMDMGGMDMSGPGGIPLASGDQDRDGLEMDVLAVRLGPVLPAWPAGLVLSVTLAGDLISDCHADTLGLEAEGVLPLPVSRREQAALVADRISWLLLLAGARRAERRLRQVRDGLLDDAEIPWCTEQLRQLTRQVSRSLRWSLRDLGRIDQDAPQDAGGPLDWSGDVLDRLHRRLAGLSGMVAALADPAALRDAPDRASMTRAGLDLVCDAVCGLDLGAARLVIASIDIDLTGRIGSHPAAVSAGSGGSS